MKRNFPLVTSSALLFSRTAFCVLMLLSGTGLNRLQAQEGCTPISPLPCDQVQVSLPYALTFNSGIAGTLADKNGAGTGFTLTDAYSGTRLTQDGAPSNSNVPGYEPSQITLSGGRLQIVTNKGIAFLTNNNQINSLGVKVDSRNKLQIETALVNPYNGSSSQQAGLWFGLDDKTFLKLAVVANKVEFRREINDVSSTVTGTTNPDQRITAAITGLNTKTVRLRLVIDPLANTAEGFYSTDGSTYLNAGAAYSTKTLSISGMGLTFSTAYAGIFATHRNSTTPVTYTFEDFSVQALSAVNEAPAFSPDSYAFSLADNAAIGALAGTTTASDPNGDALTYSIISGNTNGAFAINASTGAITVAKLLNYHTQSSYSLTVRATDAGGLWDDATVAITVTSGSTTTDFTSISWGTAASQPYGTNEVHGVVVNGKLYSFGGYDYDKKVQFGYWTPTKRAYVYDPIANKWTRIADLPHTPNGSDFGGITHEGLTTDGTDIYFAGGYTSNATGTGQIFGTKQVWKYNVASNTYTALPNLPEELAAGQLQYLKGKLHYMGGANKARADVAVHYVLDLDNLAAGWKTRAPLSDARNHPGSAVYEGKIYFIGGSHHQDASTVTQKTVEVYNPDSNTWTRVADMPIGLDHISSSVTVLGDRILVLGGETSHSVRSNKVLAYSPASNTWSYLTQLPATKSAGIAVALNGFIYYTGGNFSKTTYKGTPGVQKVSSFTLINADTDQPIKTLSNNDTLNLQTLPSRNLAIRANTSPATVGSVVFSLSGAENKTATENKAPYALHGDSGSGDYYAWTPAIGDYTLKATPYTSSGGTGTAGTALTVSFTVTDAISLTGSSQMANSIAAHNSQQNKGVQMTAYPNPNPGDRIQVTVQHLGAQEQAKLLLLDLSGRVLETKAVTADEQGNARITLASGKRLQPGFYLLQLHGAKGKTESKLVVK